MPLQLLQRLYDSEINVTITMLWDGGFDFALISYMQWPESGTTLDDLQSFVKPKAGAPYALAVAQCGASQRTGRSHSQGRA